MSSSCSSNDWSDDKGRTIVGTWEKLTIMNNNDTVRYNTFDATNVKIIINKSKKIFNVNYGQEEVTYDISHVKYVNREFIIEVKTQEGYGVRQITDTLRCKIIDSVRAYWDYYGDGSYSINGIDNIFTSSPNNYKYVYSE